MRRVLIAWAFVVQVSMVFFPQQFWHITDLLLRLASRFILLALTLVAKILELFAVVLGSAIKLVFTYPRYALASAIVAYLLVRIVGQLCSAERVSLLSTHRASAGYGAISGGLGALSPLALWRERRRRAEERVREEAQRQAAQQHREQTAEWAREQAEHRRRMEAKRTEARRKEAERMARKREEERRARQREEERAEGSVAAAWAAYVRRWEEIERRKDPLTFGMVPWPVLSTPRSTADLTLDAIATFLLSPVHSGKKSRKDRIRQAQLRWHPDRFGRFLKRVKKGDRMRVENGVGYVARCLNNLREKENA